jgi:hypothetical protein
MMCIIEYAYMAKAQITLPGGVVVNVSGTPDEISAVVSRLHGQPASTCREPEAEGKGKRKSSAAKAGLPDLIANLIDGGFFKKPKDLAAVKQALEEMGHHYPVTTLSPTMLREVRKRNLRRIKQSGHWTYTG